MKPAWWWIGLGVVLTAGGTAWLYKTFRYFLVFLQGAVPVLILLAGLGLILYGIIRLETNDTL